MRENVQLMCNRVQVTVTVVFRLSVSLLMVEKEEQCMFVQFGEAY